MVNKIENKLVSDEKQPLMNLIFEGSQMVKSSKDSTTEQAKPQSEAKTVRRVTASNFHNPSFTVSSCEQLNKHIKLIKSNGCHAGRYKSTNRGGTEESKG